MIVEGGTDNLERLVRHQLHNLFFFDTPEEQIALAEAFNGIMARVEFCFSAQSNKYYNKNGYTYFDPRHTSQYTIFLYIASNEMWRRGHVGVAGKLYALNKTLSSADIFYEVEMPHVWRCDHPVGSVIGRAVFGEGFFFNQHCTVGNNKGVFPVIGSNVQLRCGATVIGRSNIGDNVIISARSYVKDTDIPSNTIVFGQTPNLVLKPRSDQTAATLEDDLDHLCATYCCGTP